MLVCDIVDFYNQIFLNQVNIVLSDAKSPAGPVIENFLKGLNTNVTRGVPVGPAPSILIAEAIMSDIDKMILGITEFFVQYVDDLYIFFASEHKAQIFLHELSQYLYETHRLVLSAEKTRIVTAQIFKLQYLNEEGETEKNAIKEKLEELILGYPSPEKIKDIDKLEKSESFKIRSDIYYELFSKAGKLPKIDLGLMRHLLRQAGKYKIKKIIPLIFQNFNTLLPVIREMVIYFERILNGRIVAKYEKEFSEFLNNPYLELPFINMWIFTLFQNDAFNNIDLKIDYSKIKRLREQALIAKRENKLNWLKIQKNRLDSMGVWDKRAIIYASSILSKHELISWFALESLKGDIVEKSLCENIISKKK